MTKLKTILSYPGKLFNSHPLVFFLFLGFMENLLVESLSRHSLFKGLRHLIYNPVPFAVNTLIITFVLSSLSACGNNNTTNNGETSGKTLTVLNYGKYIEESVIKDFENARPKIKT